MRMEVSEACDKAAVDGSTMDGRILLCGQTRRRACRCADHAVLRQGLAFPPGGRPRGREA